MDVVYHDFIFLSTLTYLVNYQRMIFVRKVKNQKKNMLKMLCKPSSPSRNTKLNTVNLNKYLPTFLG